MEALLQVFEPIPAFGGKHTSEKLEVLSRYGKSYATALKKKNFKIAYIDAFAGAGYYRPPLPEDEHGSQLWLEPFQEESLERMVEGSARRMLQVDPAFDHYVFIEKDPRYVPELEKLKELFPEKAGRIKVRQEDANVYLQRLASQKMWSSWRALVFLDPYGMQVEWKTVEALARTQAVDLWYLFPVGIGLGRLLQRDGKIPEGNQNRLDRILGTDTWRDIFYKVSLQGELFHQDDEIVRTADYNEIEKFVVDRLKQVFSGVADQPYRLFNSKNVWLYSMCFAAGNPKGSKIALRIANHILQRKPWQRVQASSGPKSLGIR